MSVRAGRCEHDAGLITRPFYYTTLGADPTNADVVYAGAEDSTSPPMPADDVELRTPPATITISDHPRDATR